MSPELQRCNYEFLSNEETLESLVHHEIFLAILLLAAFEIFLPILERPYTTDPMVLFRPCWMHSRQPAETCCSWTQILWTRYISWIIWISALSVYSKKKVVGTYHRVVKPMAWFCSTRWESLLWVYYCTRKESHGLSIFSYIFSSLNLPVAAKQNMPAS